MWGRGVRGNRDINTGGSGGNVGKREGEGICRKVKCHIYILVKEKIKMCITNREQGVNLLDMRESVDWTKEHRCESSAMLSDAQSPNTRVY